MSYKMRKVCPGCKVLKNQTDFPKHRFHAKGGKCFQCTNVSYGRTKRYGLNRHLMENAHKICSKAIYDKELIPQPCEICGEKETDAHHDNYRFPLKVNWLCRLHHVQWHAGFDISQ